MNFETFTTENHESQNENLEQEFKKSLEEITNISITLDNIDTFADESLENLIALSESTVEAYSTQSPTTATGKELEDLAFNHFNLTNIDETIDHVTEIQDELKNIDEYIETHFPLLDKDIMSPNDLEPPSPGDTPHERNNIERPRLKTILFILKQNNIDFSELETAQGTVSKEQMRELPYYNITIPSLSRSVYVSDEYGNATFVFDTDILAEVNLAHDDLSDMTKDQKNEVINTIPGCGIRRIHSKHYAAHIENDLLSPIPEPKEAKEKQDTTSQPKAAEQTKQTPEVETEYRPLAKPKSSEGISYAPEGWLTNRSLADGIGLNHKTLRRKAETYKKEHPEWFRVYKNTLNRIYEHYSPELVDQLKSDFAEHARKQRETSDAPEAWLTNKSLARKIGTSQQSLEKRARAYRASHPEWFKDYKGASGRVDEHYSPELVDQLKSDFAEHARKQRETSDAPEAWLTNKSLASEIGVSYHTLRKIAVTYRASHPEWFKDYKGVTGSVFEHYSPELVDQLKSDFAEHARKQRETSDAPNGWFTINGLRRKINIDNTMLKKQAELYRASHPEWFKDYKDVKGRVFEYYSPELISLLKVDLADKIKETQETPDAPEEWFTNGGLAKEIGVDAKVLRRKADIYKEKHSKWFKKYKVKRGKIYEHYSPELIAQIKKDLGKE